MNDTEFVDLRTRIEERQVQLRWLRGFFHAGSCIGRMSRGDIKRLLASYRTLMRAGARMSPFELGMLDGYASSIGV